MSRLLAHTAFYFLDERLTQRREEFESLPNLDFPTVEQAWEEGIAVCSLKSINNYMLDLTNE